MKRILIRALLGLAFLMAVAVVAIYGIVWGSLPKLDGELAVTGLLHPAHVERDAAGVPTIRARTRVDLAYATGLVHAQDRFFQMDLMRRRAAGELAALVGPAAVPIDRTNRRHGFRGVARQILERAPLEQSRLVQAYAMGVNDGLQSLLTPPFEYFLLRARPTVWQAEDTILVIFAMYMELDDQEGRRESDLGLIYEVLPGELCEFLHPPGTAWDAPIVGGPLGPLPVPGPDVYDLRSVEGVSFAPASGDGPTELHRASRGASNNWAVAAGHTAAGQAILANDMHLGLRVPNTFYRARLIVAPELAAEPELDISGVTLPGVPVVVVGSNGRVAWGMTNSYGDWVDLVIAETDPADPGRYRTADGFRPFTERREIIRVNRGADESLTVRETIWGPVTGTDLHSRPLVLHWLPHEPETTNLGFLDLESAADLRQALAAANRAGMPPVNFVAVDRAGSIGWTIAGRIPLRRGYDSSRPSSWADPGTGWAGWLPASEYPRIVDPPSGRIWTANARVTAGEDLAKIGDGGFALGARAGQIRDGLMALGSATIGDMLALQLDDRALFLQRWRALILDVLTPGVLQGYPERARFRELVAADMPRAGIDSVGYRLVRAYRLSLAEQVFAAITAEVRARQPEYRYSSLRSEGPLWSLVSERPKHLLNPRHPSWEAQLLAAVDDTIAHLTSNYGDDLGARTWGERNTVDIAHPLSRALPLLARWLNMPRQPLPGAEQMPRVQAISFGAAERLAVSPGDEEQGYFHMPGGQSAHPLSPFYRAGHDAWARGQPTAFLPGQAVHRLTLRPKKVPVLTF